MGESNINITIQIALNALDSCGLTFFYISFSIPNAVKRDVFAINSFRNSGLIISQHFVLNDLNENLKLKVTLKIMS